jgi:hypothetical protein
MLVQSDEFLHAAKSAADWEERFHFNLADKKTKTFFYADLSLKKSGSCSDEWGLFIPGTKARSEGESAIEIKEGAKAVGGKSVKYKTGKDEWTLSFKGSDCAGELTITPLFSPYDFPLSPGRPKDEKREELESLLWKRYSQRCRFSGVINPKNGPSKKIEAAGQRVHTWGNMLWKQLSVSSFCHIQFKDVSINLSSIDFGGTIVSNGFISRRSGNIPVIDIELEHLEMSGSSLALSEISFIDSQDDKDLIVSRALNPIEKSEIKLAGTTFIRVRSFSEFSIIGANKKGVGFEEHLILPSALPKLLASR